MSSEKQKITTDSDPLLRPISGKKGSGVDLRYSGIYESIREARRADDPHLPQGVWQRDLKKSDFKEVERYCLMALESKGKDLQVMAWLIEAWYELYGLQGLKRGLETMAGLLETFWASAYPSLLKTDPAARLSPFMWLNEKFSLNLNSIPMTRKSTADSQEFTFGDWKIASTVSRSPATEERQEAWGHDLFAAMGRTPWSFYQSLGAEVSQCKNLVSGVEALIIGHLKGATPPLARVRRQFTDLEQAIEKIGAERGERMGKTWMKDSGQREDQAGNIQEELDPINGIQKSAESNRDMLEMSIQPSGSDFTESNAYGGGIHSRAQAYGLLNAVECYFAKTEPQNPALCLLKRILAWKDASLEAIIAEVIKEEGDINSLKTALGITKPTDSEN